MNRWQRNTLTGVLLVHLVILPALACWASQQPDVAGVSILLGVSVGQGVLASLWLVCLKASLVRRFVDALTLTSVSWLIAALTLRPYADEHASVVVVGTLGPLLVVLANSGLLVVMGPLGPWRIVLPQHPGTAPQQFSLLHGLMLITAACIALAAARGMLPHWKADLLSSRHGEEGLILPAGWLMVFFSINALLLLPSFDSLCLYKAKNRVLVNVLLIGVPIFATVMMCVQVVFAPLEVTLRGLWEFNASQLLTIGGTVIAMRATGVRFERSPPLGELPPSEGDLRLRDAMPESTIAAAGETSPKTIEN
jgi:hypothetical protein